MSENQKTVAEAKMVTVFSTRDNAMTEIPNSKATTWKELQGEFKEFGINFDKMKVIVGETKNTLEADIALVPSTNYTVYLYPIKVKAGSERTDLFDKIKAWVGKDESRKQKFIVDGNNMTRLSTDVLKKLAAQHIDGTSAPATPKAEAPKASPKAQQAATKQTVADVVQSVGTAKVGESGSKFELEAAVEKAKAAYKRAVAADVDEETQDMLLEKITKAKEALKNWSPVKPEAPKAPEPPKETPEQIAARESKAKEEKRKADRKAELERESKNLKGHLSGIQ